MSKSGFKKLENEQKQAHAQGKGLDEYYFNKAENYYNKQIKEGRLKESVKNYLHDTKEHYKEVFSVEHFFSEKAAKFLGTKKDDKIL